jgi:hypothetical protein
MPVLAGQDKNAGQRLDLFLRLGAHYRFDFLSFGIHRLELRTELPRRVVIGSGEEIDRRLGRIETAGGVAIVTDFMPAKIPAGF